MGTGYNHYSTRWQIAYDAEEFVQLKGYLFYAEVYHSSIANAACATFAVSMPTSGVLTSARCRITIESDEGVIVQIKEGAAYTGGSAVNAINMDRNSANTDHLTFTSQPTVTNEGTTLITSVLGGAGNFFSSGSPAFCSCTHLSLKYDTKYIIKVTNTSGDASKIKISMLFTET